MNLEKVNGYGVAGSDIEGGWDPKFKKELKRISMKTIMNQISFMEKIKLMFAFKAEQKKAAKVDLKEIRAKGMTNEAFINQQLQVLSLYAALKQMFGAERALKMMFSIMDATVEALRRSMPTPEDVKEYGDAFEFFREYISAMPEPARKAGCHHITIPENTDKAIEFDVTYCVWYELAKKMNVTEACAANCYSDEMLYPDYFKSFGITYKRSATLAQGAPQCDFRFEKDVI